MKTHELTATRKPNKKERADFMQFMRTLGVDELVVHVEGEDDVVLRLERRDADGRVLLMD